MTLYPELLLTHVPVAKAGMLIRRPAEDVYNAFVDPQITTRFWFTRSTGRLEVDQQVKWDWEIYAVSTLVEVKALEPGKRILVEWGVGEQPTMVEWIFSPKGEDATFVSITNTGFTGEGDSLVEQALGSAAGFGLVLAGLKAYLEYGIELNLVADRFPERWVDKQEKH